MHVAVPNLKLNASACLLYIMNLKTELNYHKIIIEARRGCVETVGPNGFKNIAIKHSLMTVARV